MSSETIRGYRRFVAAPTRLATPTPERPFDLQHIQIGRTVVPFLELGSPQKNKLPVLMYPGISAPPESLYVLGMKMLGKQRDGHVIIFEAPKIGVPLFPSLPWYAEVTTEAAKQVTGKSVFNVLGHSWGGLVAEETAHQRGVHIEHMGILASIPVRPHTSPVDIFLAFPTLEMIEASQAIMKTNRTKVDPGAVYGGLIKEYPELLEQFMHLIHRKIDKKSHIQQLRAVMRSVAPLAAKNMTQRVIWEKGPPALVVLGRDDPIIPYEYTKRQAGELLMDVHTVEDGHLHPITSDNEVAGVLQVFFNTPVHELYRPRKTQSYFRTAA